MKKKSDDKIENHSIEGKKQPTGIKKYLHTILDYVAPIKKSERVITGALVIIFTLKVFIYSSSRLLKDNLIVANLGGQIIPFMKIVVSVSAVLFATLYLFGISHFNRRQLFYITLMIFMGFFAIFGFVIYPNKDYFILSDTTINGILSWLGGNTGSFFNTLTFIKIFLIASGLGLFTSITNFKLPTIRKNLLTWNGIFFGIYSLLYFFAGAKLATKMALPVQIIKLWPYSCYYIMSELWGAYSLQLLFWNFANYQVTSSEAKRIYPFVILLGQTGQILAAHFVEHLVGASNFIFILSVITAISGIVIISIHEYIFKTSGRETTETFVTVKTKPSFSASLKAMASSPIVLFVTSICIFYGLTCNILETYWKMRLSDYVASVATSSAAARTMFSVIQSKYFAYTGYLAVISALCSGFLIRKISWLFAAMVTPAILGIGTLLFYGLDIFGGTFNSLFTGKSVLFIAMMIGMVILVFLKATKYTLFDNTKEMLLIGLGPEVKSQAKVADTLAGRFGKSGGAYIFTIFAIFTNNITNLGIRIFMFALIMMIAIVWSVIVFKLSTIYKKATLKEEKENQEKQNIEKQNIEK